MSASTPKFQLEVAGVSCKWKRTFLSSILMVVSWAGWLLDARGQTWLRIAVFCSAPQSQFMDSFRSHFICGGKQREEPFWGI